MIFLKGESRNWTEYTIEHIANKSGLDKDLDFLKIYEGDNVTEALNSIKPTGKDFSTIVLFCTRK